MEKQRTADPDMLGGPEIDQQDVPLGSQDLTTNPNRIRSPGEQRARKEMPWKPYCVCEGKVPVQEPLRMQERHPGTDFGQIKAGRVVRQGAPCGLKPVHQVAAAALGCGGTIVSEKNGRERHKATVSIPHDAATEQAPVASQCAPLLGADARP